MRLEKFKNNLHLPNCFYTIGYSISFTCSYYRDIDSNLVKKRTGYIKTKFNIKEYNMYYL